MPTYDYECSACGHVWEVFQSMSENPITKCEKCGKKKAKRLIGGGAGFLFGGDGFYTTDYRSESYKSGKKKDSEAKATPKDSGGSCGGGACGTGGGGTCAN